MEKQTIGLLKNRLSQIRMRSFQGIITALNQNNKSRSIFAGIPEPGTGQFREEAHAWKRA